MYLRIACSEESESGSNVLDAGAAVSDLRVFVRFLVPPFLTLFFWNWAAALRMPV
jgi:hypothetical protein